MEESERERERDERFGERGWRRGIREAQEKEKKRRMGRTVLDAMAYEWMRAKTNTREICKLWYSNVKDPHCSAGRAPLR